MSKRLMHGLLGTMIAVSAAMPIAQVDAAPRNRDRQEAVVEKFCREHPRRPVCVDWRRDRDRWDEARYRRWYREHRDELDINDAALAGLFGFAAGAIVGAAASQANNAPVVVDQEYPAAIPSAGGYPAGSQG